MTPASATSPEREHRAGALFLAAAELAQEQRDTLLSEVGKTDPSLRTEVEALLEADRRNSDGFLRGPMPEYTRPEAETKGPPEAPKIIGAYEVVRELGHGQHATVYLARQREPVEREVAIKVLLNDAGSHEIVRRFETERRMLALMEHPNITRLFEAGVTENGHAYFVMEYVRGGPICGYCLEWRLTMRQRLRLFCDVCHAVEHAHQRSIIHRDLKPTNILVSTGTGPVVKVIDFGVARASGAGLYSFPSHTLHGQMVGTIAYMSPEQIGGDGLLVDTRSDVYGLGAVLYEIICDAPAFDTSSAGPATVITRITLQGPPGPREVRRSIPREVEAIITRAMEREPTHRYQTVAALRTDIERYLAGRAVEPMATRPLYVARKFAMRHRLGLAMILLFAAFLAAATVHGVVSQRDKFDLSVRLAQTGFDHSKMMAKTAGQRGQRLPLLQVLESQSEALLEQAPNHAGVLHLRADVLGARGDLHLENGEAEAARGLFEAALLIRERLVSIETGNYTYRIERSIATVRLGDAVNSLRLIDEAERLYLRAMAMDERMYAERPGMPRVITLLAWSCDRLGAFASARKDQERATSLYARCLSLMERLCTVEISADAHRGLSTALTHAADAARRRGDAPEYRAMIERALGEADIAVSLSPTDRLARWAQVSARSVYLDSRRDQLTPREALSIATDTLERARGLAAMDPNDFTMHAVHARAIAVAAECAEAAGDIDKAQLLRDEEVHESQRVHDLLPSNEEAEHGLADSIRARGAFLARHGRSAVR